MTSTFINVSPQMLEETASRIEEATSEYERLYTNLYAEIDKMESSWSGKDNIAYTNQIRSYQKNMLKIAEAMKQYSLCIRNCARSYRETQDEIASKANRL